MQFKPKKSLGQNFLKSKEALRTICEAGDIRPTDTIIEVGPGKGALTELLLQQAGTIIAIEKDRRLIPFLQEKFANNIAEGKLEIREDDILEINIGALRPQVQNYKLIANIPYYITGQLIRTFLSGEFQPEKMVLLVQKEVAERVVARDGKESLLSISVKAYGTPKYVQTVKAKYFSPEPNVDSAVISISNISKKLFTESDITEDHFFKVVRAGFAHKRKKAASNLAEHFLEKSAIENIFSERALNKNARPEDVGVADWIAIAQKLK